jgi:ATP synthase F1 delta subunit
MQQSSSLYKLVRRYAQAFFNIFGDDIDGQGYERMQVVGTALVKNHRLMNLLQVSFTHHHEVKQKYVEYIIKQFHLPQSLIKLALLLIDADRTYLLPYILQYVANLYEKKMNIMNMDVYASHTLSTNLHAQVEQVLSGLCHATVRIVPVVDVNLIAGIRAHSKTVMWESSVRKTLKALHAQIKK